MENFKYGKPSDLELYRAICMDYFRAKTKKLNPSWRKIEKSYWEAYRSEHGSFSDFLRDMNNVKENLKKNKERRQSSVSQNEILKKIPGVQLKIPLN